MNRKEFLEMYSGLTREELKEFASQFREKAGARMPLSVQEAARSLDDVTEVMEFDATTAWGKTHYYIIRPVSDSKKMPVMINVHGGGWTLKHSERDIYFCRRMVARTGCLAVDIDFVSAPEYPFPAAIEQVEALLDMLPQIVTPFGGDCTRVIFCGQSAGANLLASVAQRKRYTEQIHVAGQIICYPPMDLVSDHFEGGELDANGMRTEFYGFFYVPEFKERYNPDVSPVYLEKERAKLLPPTAVMTCGLDNLQYEGKKYYQLLKEAGCQVEHQHFEGCHHSFLVNMADNWPAGDDFVAEYICRFSQI